MKEPEQIREQTEQGREDTEQVREQTEQGREDPGTADSAHQEKSEKELLAELTALVRKSEEENRKNRLIGRAAAIVLMAALVIVVPATVVTMNRAQKTMSRIDTMVDQVNEFAEENSELLGNIVTGVNQIDFSSLNEAIETLNQDVKNLHRVLDIFN